MADRRTILIIDYTNWRGERSMRTVIPERIEFANSEWHPDTQWLLLGWDCEKRAEREFAFSGIHSVRPLSHGGE